MWVFKWKRGDKKTFEAHTGRRKAKSKAIFQSIGYKFNSVGLFKELIYCESTQNHPNIFAIFLLKYLVKNSVIFDWVYIGHPYIMKSQMCPLLKTEHLTRYIENTVIYIPYRNSVWKYRDKLAGKYHPALDVSTSVSTCRLLCLCSCARGHPSLVFAPLSPQHLQVAASSSILTFPMSSPLLWAKARSSLFLPSSPGLWEPFRLGDRRPKRLQEPSVPVKPLQPISIGYLNFSFFLLREVSVPSSCRTFSSAIMTLGVEVQQRLSWSLVRTSTDSQVYQWYFTSCKCQYLISTSLVQKQPCLAAGIRKTLLVFRITDDLVYFLHHIQLMFCKNLGL